jgi:hypothetical protein
MASLTIPIEIELTARSRAIMDALSKVVGPQFQDEATPSKPEGVTTPELNSGERYAGMVLDQNGTLLHHLVLMAQRPDGKLNWKDATAWAETVGGTLPTRQEQALLYANCKPHLKPEWHWSGETHDEDASCAWGCNFTNGDQFNRPQELRGLGCCRPPDSLSTSVLQFF